MLLNNKEFFGILISFLTVFVPLATFLISKNKEQKQINFNKFHNELMKGLANIDGKTGLDQQVAIIYEFRNYSEYFPVIKRTLHFQIDRWEKQIKSNPHFRQLINEAKKTLEFSNKTFIERYFIKKLHIY